MSHWFNLEAALQTNGVTESDVKEVIKKQSENAPKLKDDVKTEITQMIGFIRSMLTQLFPHQVIFEVIVEVGRV